MDDLGQKLPPVLSDFTHRTEAGGQTVVYLVRQGRSADAGVGAGRRDGNGSFIYDVDVCRDRVGCLPDRPISRVNPSFTQRIPSRCLGELEARAANFPTLIINSQPRRPV